MFNTLTIGSFFLRKNGMIVFLHACSRVKTKPFDEYFLALEPRSYISTKGLWLKTHNDDIAWPIQIYVCDF